MLCFNKKKVWVITLLVQKLTSDTNSDFRLALIARQKRRKPQILSKNWQNSCKHFFKKISVGYWVSTPCLWGRRKMYIWRRPHSFFYFRPRKSTSGVLAKNQTVKNFVKKLIKTSCFLFCFSVGCWVSIPCLWGRRKMYIWRRPHSSSAKWLNKSKICNSTQLQGKKEALSSWHR